MTIYETVIFDGRIKTWRIFNITTGSVYSTDYETEKDAYDDIEDGQIRDEHTVKKLTRGQLLDSIDFYNKLTIEMFNRNA